MSTQFVGLYTPEILHLILAELPMRSLLTTAQRVCRRWRETISSSPVIQQKLFFRIMPETTARRPKPQLNPLLQEVFPAWFQPHRFPGQAIDAMAAHVFDGLPIDRHPEAFLRAGATWRHMLVQQPPALALGILDVRIRSDDTAEIEKHYAYFDEEGGLRMGLLYDLVQEWFGTPKHFCQLVWWRLPSLQPIEPTDNQETLEVTNQMLEEADVVLQRQTVGMLPMQPPRINLEWRRKFRSENCDVVGVV